MRGKNLGVVAENGRASGDAYDEVRVERLVALGGALSDPIRVKMLGMMAEGRGCCSLPDCGVPAADQDAGICVCEFEAYFGMGQSKVSYHMKKLKGAGLVHEERRGPLELLLAQPGRRPGPARRDRRTPGNGHGGPGDLTPEEGREYSSSAPTTPPAPRWPRGC